MLVGSLRGENVDMADRPLALVFDVNETLLDLRGLDAPFSRSLARRRSAATDVVARDLAETAERLLAL
jgi:hypothetical protein